MPCAYGFGDIIEFLAFLQALKYAIITRKPKELGLIIWIHVIPAQFEDMLAISVQSWSAAGI